MKNISRNLTMLVDYYEITMGNGYFHSGMKDKIAYFDLYFRKNPDQGGYAIAAGLEQAIEYVKTMYGEKIDDPAYNFPKLAGDASKWTLSLWNELIKLLNL